MKIGDLQNPDKMDKRGKKRLTNAEIFEKCYYSGLFDTCLHNQLKKAKGCDLSEDDKNDFKQDMYLVLLEYNNDKLNDAWLNNHLNALITAIIRTQLVSTNTSTYKKYKRWNKGRLDFKTGINEEKGENDED